MASALPPVIATFLGNITDLKAKTAEARADLASTATSADADAAKVEASTAKSATASSGAMSKLAGVGKVALIAGAAGVAAISIASVKAATDYDTLTTQLVTGAGESSKNIDMVSKGLLAMAPAVGIGPDALAKSMFTVESAGYHGADGLNVMKAAAEGAKIGGADATVVANGLTTAMTDYAIPASQAAATTSKLVETVASGKTTMGDLSSSLSNVLPAAKAAGVGLDQVLGAMATMTGEGISADQASQDLAGTIRSLQAPTQEQTQAMQALGLNSLTVSNNLGKEGLTGTMSDLVAAITQHMGPAGDVIESTFKKSQTAAADAQTELKAMPASMQKIATSFMNGQLTSTQWRAALKGMTTDQKQLAQQFATTVQSGQGFNTLIKSGGPDAETFSAALAGVTGGATGMNTALALTGTNAATFATNVKNISGASADAKGNVQGWSETQKDFGVQLDQAKAGLQAILVTIGEKLIPIIQDVIRVGVQWANYLSQHRTLLLAIAGVIGGVLVTAIVAYVAHLAVAAVESLKDFAKMVAAGASWVAENTAGFAASIAAGAVWIGEHLAMAALYIASQVAMAAAATAAFIAENLATLGIVAGIALLIAGVYELYEHWGSVWGFIKGVATDAKNWIVGVFTDVVDFLKQWGPLILTVLMPFVGLPLLIMQNWGSIESFFEGLWNDVVGFFETAYDDVETVFMAPFKAEIWLVEAAFTGAVSGIKSTMTDVKNFLVGIYNDIKSGVTDALNREVAGLETVWHSAWNGMGNAVKAVWDFIKPLIDDFENGIKTISSAVSSIGGIASKAGGLISKIPGLAVGGWTPGALGQPTPAIVHGGEYMLSDAMLSGQQAIDPSIVAAVMANSSAANIQTVASGGTGSTGGATVSPATTSSGGGDVHYHTNITVQGSVIDSQGLYSAVESAVMQARMTRGPGSIASTFSGQPSGSR